MKTASKVAPLKSQVISTRVPVDVLSTIDSICQREGLNRSQWLTGMVAEHQSNHFLKEGGTIQTRFIPKEVEQLLYGAGMTVTGILLYNLVANVMAKATDENGKLKFSNGEVEFVSVITAVAAALAGFGVIKALANE